MASTNDKEFNARMQGMLYAYNIAKEKGIEGLEAEIRLRNITRLPLNVNEKQIRALWQVVCNNLQTNIVTCACVALENTFGFKEVRLKRFLKAFDEAATNTFDLDWLGEHYVSMTDYAVYLNEEFNLGINTEIVNFTQDTFDDKRKDFKVAKLEEVIRVLRENEFEDAANFFEKYK